MKTLNSGVTSNTGIAACKVTSVMMDSTNLWTVAAPSTPDSSAHGILQARILEWIATYSSRDLPDPGTDPVSLMSPVWQAVSLQLAPPGKPLGIVEKEKKIIIK